VPIYCDASVIVAFYLQEALSEEVEEILLGTESPTLSHLAEVEVFSAIARKERTGELTLAQAGKIRTAFSAHLEGHFYARVPVRTAHFRSAGNWLAGNTVPLKTLDALHIAVAGLEDKTLLTADVQQARAAEELGVDVKLLG